VREKSIQLPDKFKANFISQFGQLEFDALLMSFESNSPSSIRLHPTKGTGLYPDSKAIPWYSELGRYLSPRPQYVLDPLYHAGAYYSQEASSMVFNKFLKDLEQPVRALDLCAAPGGKSSLLYDELPAGSLLVSNELVGKRNMVLQENLTKWGTRNVIITRAGVDDFNNFKECFDIILIDAPCSGEGMFRKDEYAVSQWSPALVKQCSVIQKNLLTMAWELLAPGGRLIYSTCTFESAENFDPLVELYAEYSSEMLPVYLNENDAKKWDLTTVEIPVSDSKPFLGYYCFMHKVQGEGQYLSCIQKDGDDDIADHKPLKKKVLSKFNPKVNFVNEGIQDLLFTYLDRVVHTDTVFINLFEHLIGQMENYKAGTHIGTIIRQDLIPDIALILDNLESKNSEYLDLNLSEALQYLQRKSPENLELGSNKWLILRHSNINIGWGKVVNGRLNVHYPSDWKIRKQLSFEEY